MSNPVILIPARLRSTRLPDKPLASIGGRPMIAHVVARALEADIGPVFVACAELAIKNAAEAAGAQGIMTDPDLPSGTDRIFQALTLADPDRRFDRIVNLQGDLPTITASALNDVLAVLTECQADIGTLVCATDDEREKLDPNVVKAIATFQERQERFGRALYFTRATAPTGPGPLLHHIGIYSFSRGALERFATLPPSVLERRERLEQLRALENGMSIGVCKVDTVPFGVDTPADLERARLLLGHEN